MDDLVYDRIEQQLVAALPEIRPAAEHYWRTEGEPGTDCGAYIFFEGMFAIYVEVLLTLPASPRRDELLRRAFAFVEGMLASADGHVHDLAFIGLYEGRGPAWVARAAPFVGPRAIVELDKHEPEWRISSDTSAPETSREIFDEYGVRHVVAHELRHEGLILGQIPGTTEGEKMPA